MEKETFLCCSLHDQNKQHQNRNKYETIVENIR
jgi:hypothetical protein